MRIPSATYRLQFNADFTFEDARRIVDYLVRLGISDLYASPIFRARPGSMHGYDVVDPNALNPEIGSPEALRTLASDLRERGIGWLQDIVPNHMAYDKANAMLMDVLENGDSSEHYPCFDIEWDHAYESLRGRLLAPFLGKSYGESLKDGEIRLEFGPDGFSVRYYGLSFPLRIESYVQVLMPGVNTLKNSLGADEPDFIKFIGVLYMLKAFPCQELGNERHDQVRFAKRMLWELSSGNERIRRFIERNVDAFNDDQEESRTRLDVLLKSQFYRLSLWKVASEEINYRRFFSINELISLRIEDPDVFRECHRLIFKLVSEGIFTGLRIDHIDGLYDPLRYLRALQEKTGGIYTTVEKILGFGEDLPTQWPVQGTTGYDFLNVLNGVFCRKENEREMDRIYTAFTGDRIDYTDLLYAKKGVIVEHFMTGDVDNLAQLMKHISSKDRAGADITIYGLKRAIFEVLSLFPIYRTYISAETFSEADRRTIAETIERAERRNPDLIYELSYLRKFLLLEYEDYLSEADKKSWRHFVMRFQQFSGPLMAKGFEDTTLYVYNRLISLNEVGGEPFAFGVPLEAFHAFMERRAKRWPHAMSATATHDTKRGEDVRARINVLSEIPREWDARVRTWRELNRRRKARMAGHGVPSRNDEYFLYQTLVGTFPFDPAEYPSYAQRLKDYTIKAIREAKEHTGWIQPDEAYEGGCLAFIDTLLVPEMESAFLADFLPFQARIAHYGMINSLAQLLLKITSPGIPDFFQGTELWDFSFVDPDNRRPVDYGKRQTMLEEIRTSALTADYLASLLAAAPDGRIKLMTIHRALQARQQRRTLFTGAGYTPLRVEGERKDHVIAYIRQHKGDWCLTIAPRFCTALVAEGEFPLGAQVWGNTRIVLPGDAPHAWKNALTDRAVDSEHHLSLAEALTDWPLALLFCDA